MTAIRVIFDGKAFIPQQVVSLPDQSEALVIIQQHDPREQVQLDGAIRAYYEHKTDADDDAWATDVAPLSHTAWDED